MLANINLLLWLLNGWQQSSQLIRRPQIKFILANIDFLTTYHLSNAESKSNFLFIKISKAENLFVRMNVNTN